MRSREFFDSAARDWDSHPMGASAEKAIERATQALELPEGATVLDIGCGTGRTIAHVATAVGEEGRVVGVDFSHAMLTEARRKALARNAAYVQADAHDLPVRSGSIEAVLCYAAFAHFDERDKFFKEAHRALRAGGRLVVCHPMNSAELSRFHSEVGDAVGGHVLPEAESVAAMAQRCGFDVVAAVEEKGLYLVALRRPGGASSSSK